MWLLRTLPNNVLGHIGIKHGFKGANACITNHSVGGALAVIEALEALRTGEADRAVAVGHDTPIEPQMVLYYQRLGLLAADALRPFDARRDGSLFGEGAGALVLETEASAAARDATVLGEVLGGGVRVRRRWASLAIRDDGDGLARAIRAGARRRAARAARDVGMIVAHGNGTPAVRRVGSGGDPHASSATAPPPVTAFKWAFGHLIAAAGILETVLALAALRQRTSCRASRRSRSSIPTARACACPPRAADAASDVALILCRGFAATNAALRGPRRADSGARTRWRTPSRRPAAAASTPSRSRASNGCSRETPAGGSRASSFPPQELADAATARAAPRASPRASPQRKPASKLFPREVALGQIEPADFSVARDNYGAPQVVCGPRAAGVLGRHRIAAIALSLTHDRTSASAVALAEPATHRGAARRPAPLPLLAAAPRDRPREPASASTATRWPQPSIVALAQAHYGHLWRLAGEFLRFRWLSARTQGGAGARREPRRSRRRAGAGQGRPRADRPLRQLGGRDDRRHRQLSRRCAAGSTSCAARSSRAGSTRSSRGASTGRASASSASAARSTRCSTCSRPAT